MDAAARAEWCATRTPEDAAAELRRGGIPAAAVVPAYAVLDDPQLAARGVLPADRPSRRRHAGVPDAGRCGCPPAPRWRGAGRARRSVSTPTTCCASSVSTDAELDALRAAHVIGTEPLDRGR